MTADPDRILLIEDDESLRLILARHLRASGFAVEEAGSAEQALEVLGAGLRPHLVILDLNLPGETGWELLRGPALAAAGSPPVVVATATTLNPRRLAEFSVAGYLPKPFALETLRDVVGRLTTRDAADPA
jgi:DNA-binding response OmpR family regulator